MVFSPIVVHKRLNTKMQEVKLNDFLKVSTNKIYASKSWYYRKKLKDDYLQWFLVFKNRFIPVNVPIELEFDFYFARNPLDCDNCSFSAKMITDCLIKHNIIKDDNPKWVRSVKYISQKSKDKTDYCIIRILPLEEDNKTKQKSLCI